MLHDSRTGESTGLIVPHGRTACAGFRNTPAVICFIITLATDNGTRNMCRG